MSLRLRLTLLMIVLTAIGLGAAGSLNVVRLRNALESGVGDRIEGLPVQDIARTTVPAGLDRVLPEDWLIAVVAPDEAPDVLFGGAAGDAPQLAGVDFAARAAAGDSISVERVDAEGSVRVALYELEILDGSWVAVGASLDPVDDTIGELIRITILVSAIVLAVIAALSWWLIGLAMRPLSEVSRTAEKIALGNLGARAPEAGPSEVAKVGAALNVMLDSVEQAFDRQVASENQRRQFLSDATHELRAPLTNIQGYAGLFRRGSASDPEELAVLLDRVEGEAARMGELLGDLTVLADHDEGRAHPQDLTDLGAIAFDVATSLRSRRPQRTIELEAEAGRAWVLGDQAGLGRMVRNLADNAVEHTPDDVVVSITVRRDDAHVTLMVHDDGPGIPDDIAPRIFDRFFTAGTSAPDAARTPRRQGRGLGLSIVQTVATAHNGTVSMDTDAATGTTFNVVLPAATAMPSSLQQRIVGNDVGTGVVSTVDG